MTADTSTTVQRGSQGDKTNSRHNWRTSAGLTVVALGAPLVAAAPAAAQDGHGPHVSSQGNAQAEAQPQGAAAAQSSAAPDTQPAPQGPPPAGGGSSQAGAQAQVEAQAGSANAGGQAHVEAEADVQAQAGAEPYAGGASRHESRDGTEVEGRDGTKVDGRDETKVDGRDEARVDGRDEAEVESRGETAGGSHAKSTGEAEHDDHGVVPRHGDAEGAGFTNVGVAVREDRRRGSRATAHVKAGRKLEAAIRAEARAAARDEVRRRSAPHKARARARIAIEATSRSEDRRRAGAEESAAVLRMLRVAWETGGPARADAVFELCFGRRSAEQARPEALALLASFERQAKIHGREKTESAGGLNTEAEGGEAAEAEGRGEIESRRAAAAVEGRGAIEGRADARGEFEAAAEAEAAPNAQPAPAPAAPVSLGAPSANTPLAPGTGQAEQGPGGTRLVADVTSQNGGTGQAGRTGFVSTAGDTSASQGRELASTGYQLPLAGVFGVGALAAGIALRRRTRGVSL